MVQEEDVEARGALADAAWPAVDAKLKTKPALSSDDAAKVAKLRADGEAYHKAGKHDESMKSLLEAKKILGI